MSHRQDPAALEDKIHQLHGHLKGWELALLSRVNPLGRFASIKLAGEGN